MAFLVALAASGHSLQAQVLNGGFCLGADHWTVFRMPGQVAVPGAVEAFDIDGGGPLLISDAFVAQTGTYDQRRLQQSVFLYAGTNYHFGMDLGCIPYSNNGDGGTISVSIGSTSLGSFAFGTTSYGVNEYGRIVGNYVPQVTGEQTLTIDISRGYFAGGGTPVNYIDNVELTPNAPISGVPVPSVSIDDVGVSQIPGVSTNARFTVTLSAPSTHDVMVHFMTTNGTAAAGADFAFTNGTLTFPPGVTVQFISVLISGTVLSNAPLAVDFGVLIDAPCGDATCSDCFGRGVIATARFTRETLSVVITNPADGATFYAPGAISITGVTEYSSGLVPDLITFGGTGHDIGGYGPMVENEYRYEAVGSWSLQGQYGPDGNALWTFWGIPPTMGNVITFKRVEGSLFRFLSLELRGRIEGARNDVVKMRGFLNGAEVASQVFQSSNETWRLEVANSSFAALVDTLSLELVEATSSALLFDNLRMDSGQTTPGGVQRVDFFASPSVYLGTATNPPYILQWSNNVPGAYTLTAVATAASGLTATSAPVHIVIIQPCSGSLTANGLSNQTACACEAVLFTAAASSPDPVSFLWRANGRGIPGQTSSNLVLQSLKASDAGIYSVEITTPCKSVTNTATLTIPGGDLSNPLVIANTNLITINDFTTATPYPSTIEVRCVPGAMRKVVVNLFGLTHTSTHDIDILLANPLGKGLKLMSDAGRSAADAIVTFTDASTTPVPLFPGDIVSGVYRPTDYGVASDDAFPAGISYVSNLAGLNAATPNGVWSLYVRDDETLDTGRISGGWSLAIEWDDPGPRLSSPSRLADGRFQMVLSSLAGRTHVIETSIELRAWIPVSTNLMAGTNMPLLIPALTPQTSSRFFRVVRCPQFDRFGTNASPH